MKFKLIPLKDALVKVFAVSLHKVFKKSPTIWLSLLVILSITSSIPLFFLEYSGNAENIYKQTSGLAVDIYNRIKEAFPMNSTTDFDEARIIDLVRFGRVLIQAKDGGSILRNSIFTEIIKLDELVNSISFEKDNLTWTYHNLCAKNKGQCFKNPLLSLKDKVNAIENGKYNIKYPFYLNMKTMEFHFYGHILGDTETVDDGYIKSSKVGALMYFLDHYNPMFNEMNIRWELEFEKALNEAVFSNISINFMTKDRLGKAYNLTLFYWSFCFGIVISVALLCLVLIKIIKKERYLGLVFNTLVPIASGISAISIAIFIFSNEATLVSFASIMVVTVISFLDFFVFERISSQKSTESTEEIFLSIGPNLLCSTLSLIACWAMGFLIYVKIFQIISISWTLHAFLYYIYQICFYTFWLEKFPSSLKKAETSQPIKGKQWWNSTKIGLVIFCGVLYLVYFIYSAWSIQFIHLRMESDNFYEKSSAAYKFSLIEKDHFVKFYYRIQMIVDEPLDYSNASVQNQIEHLINAHPLTLNSPLNESWLKFYLIFLKDPRTRFFTLKYNVSTLQGFIDCLRNVFLKMPVTKRFTYDVVFNSNYTQITTARFFPQAIGVNDSEEGLKFLGDLNEIAQTAPIKVNFFNATFPIFSIINHLLSLWFIYVIVTTVLIAVFMLVFSHNILLSFSSVLLVGVWQLGFLSGFVLSGIDFNTPTLMGYILFTGIGTKFFLLSLPTTFDINIICSGMQTILALLLGFVVMYAYKVSLNIIDYLFLNTLITSLLCLVCFVLPCVYFLKEHTPTMTLPFTISKEDDANNGYARCASNESDP